MPTLPPPATATFIRCALVAAATATGGGGASNASSAGNVVLHQDEMEQVAVLPDQAGRVEPRDAGAGDGDEPDLALGFEDGQLLAGEVLGQDAVDQEEHPGGVAPVRGEVLRKQPAAHLVDGPRHRCHGRDAETLIDLRALRVVDARHHALDAEGLAGDPGAENIGVVSGRHGGDGVRVLDARVVQRIAIKSRSLNDNALEIGRQPAKRFAVSIDDGDRVTLGLEGSSKPGADPPAADDDDVHRSIQAGRSGIGRCRRQVRHGPYCGRGRPTEGSNGIITPTRP